MLFCSFQHKGIAWTVLLPLVYSSNLIVNEYGAGSIRGSPAVAEPFRSVIVDRFVSLSMVSSFIIELSDLRSSVRLVPFRRSRRHLRPLHVHTSTVEDAASATLFLA
ncbi:unnamed protein product [Angiostrongylus costaricensis]|uniref:Secreted protein n=1 Tax=Angiostrongylus costaricensis TaxID=334426 RepID=A0A0R3PEC2_ANGCS|nr:unnamed protein product [Angiostrongylus costaricensis]